MYILIREEIPLGFAVLAAARASLAAYLKFADSDDVAAWLDWTFAGNAMGYNHKRLRIFVRRK